MTSSCFHSKLRHHFFISRRVLAPLSFSLSRWLKGNEPEPVFQFVRQCADSMVAAYLPIVRRRKDDVYGEAQRHWQVPRNVWDDETTALRSNESLKMTGLDVLKKKKSTTRFVLQNGNNHLHCQPFKGAHSHWWCFRFKEKNSACSFKYIYIYIYRWNSKDA